MMTLGVVAFEGRTGMSLQRFAARRSERLNQFDDEIRPIVEAALPNWGGSDWYADIVEGAGVLWLEIFNKQSPTGHPGAMIDTFLRELGESLAKTAEPASPPTEAEIDRVVRWVGVYSVNSATYFAGRDMGGLEKTWITMDDDKVRSIHRAVDDVTVPILGTFEVGGSRLHFPGEPVGPPEVWINCRCLLSITGGVKFGATSPTPGIGADTTLPPTRSGDNAPVVVATFAEAGADRDGTRGHPGTDILGVRRVPKVTKADAKSIAALVVDHLRPAPEGKEPGDPVGRNLSPQFGDPEVAVAYVGGLAVGGKGTAGPEPAVTTPIHLRPEAFFESKIPTGHAPSVPVIKGESMAIDAKVEDEVDDDTEVDEDDGPLDDLMSETPWHGVLTTEGNETGDKRKIATDSLSFPDPAHMPAPLMYQEYTDGVPHGSSVRVGRIDEMWRHESGEIRARGAFNLNVLEAHKAIDGIMFGGGAGVSVDLDSAEFELEWPEGSEDMDLEEMLEVRPVEVITAARLRGATMVGFGAFIEGYIALGLDFDDEAEVETDQDAEEADPGEEVPDEVDLDAVIEMYALIEAGDTSDENALLASAAFAPGTHDGPGWITHPRDTQRLRSYWVKGEGAAKIRWGAPGDFNRCRLQLGKYVNPAFLAGTCANLHKEALKIWPSTHAKILRGGTDKNDIISRVSLVASAGVDLTPARYVADPEFTEVTPLIIEDDHIFGHLAAWGTCHLAIHERCVMPPHSETDYSYYANGITETDEGPVRTGRLMMWTGHAGSLLAAHKASRHYDDTGHAVADLAVGEDAFGIWFSGRLREGVTEEDIRVLRASAVSGDWRDVRMTNDSKPNEMVGLIAVNVGGFPMPRAHFGMIGDKQVSLVASAGIVMPREIPEVESALGKQHALSAEELLMISRSVADEIEYRGKKAERLADARDQELIEAAQTRRGERLAAARTLEG